MLHSTGNCSEDESVVLGHKATFGVIGELQVAAVDGRNETAAPTDEAAFQPGEESRPWYQLNGTAKKSRMQGAAIAQR